MKFTFMGICPSFFGGKKTASGEGGDRRREPSPHWLNAHKEPAESGTEQSEVAQFWSSFTKSWR